MNQFCELSAQSDTENTRYHMQIKNYFNGHEKNRKQIPTINKLKLILENIFFNSRFLKKQTIKKIGNIKKTL